MSNSKAPYKKVACRHFDAHSGKPLSPCTKGSDCSFLHPSDFEWSRRNTAKKTYRSAPLAPQADLFLRSHREELSSNSRIQEGRNPSKGSLGLKYRKRSGTPDRDRSLFRDTPTPMERNKPVVENSRRQEFVRMGEKTRTRNITEEIKKPAKPSFSETGHASKERPTEKPDASPKTIPVTVNVQNSDKVVRLFQGLASISRETDQLSEAQKKEESKIETYKNISATLKSITSSAGSAVAPQMALSLLAQTECKNRIEKNNATCQKMWSDAINVFVEEVTKVVDNRVQVVLRCIRNEAEQAALSIGATNKRKREDNNAKNTPGGEMLQDMGIGREFKRQKLSAESMDSSTETQEGALIREMKLKMEEQARAIAKLAQENNEVRDDVVMEDM